MPHEILLRLQVPEDGSAPRVVAPDSAGNPGEFGLPDAGIFRGLSRDALSQIAAKGRRRAFAAGSTIFEEGEVADSVFIVVSGEVRRFRVDRETSTRENVVTLSLAGPGATFGDSALINATRIVSAEAVQRTECLQLLKDDVMGLMVQYPLFGLAMSQAALQKTAHAEDRVCNFGGGRWAHKRLASALLKMAEEEGRAVPDGIEIKRPLTQSDLASIVQAARETVSIHMQKLKKSGAVKVAGKTITVVPDRLRATAGL